MFLIGKPFKCLIHQPILIFFLLLFMKVSAFANIEKQNAFAEKTKEEMMAIKQSLLLYYETKKHFPPSTLGLEGLLAGENEGSFIALSRNNLLRDDWNEHYFYSVATHGKEEIVDLISKGSDKKLGTRDDIHFKFSSQNHDLEALTHHRLETVHIVVQRHIFDHPTHGFFNDLMEHPENPNLPMLPRYLRKDGWSEDLRFDVSRGLFYSHRNDVAQGRVVRFFNPRMSPLILAKPTWMKAHWLNDTTLRVSYNASPGASHYVLYFSSDGGSTYHPHTTLNTSYTKSGLHCGKHYYFKVRAINSFSNHAISETHVERTLRPLPAVTGLRGGHDDIAHHIRVSWDLIACNPNVTYSVYRDLGMNPLVRTQSNSYRNRGVATNAEHTYRVIATTSDAQSEVSIPLKAQANGKCPVSTPPPSDFGCRVGTSDCRSSDSGDGS